MKIIQKIYTIWCLIWLLTSFLLCYPLMFLGALHPKIHVLTHIMNKVWGVFFFTGAGLFHKKIGISKFDSPAVYCANHTSYLDIPLLFLTIPGFFMIIGREFAFGTAYIKDANTLLYDSTEYETYQLVLNDSTGIASHGYSGRQGPLRVGFAASEESNRLQSGASYWGIMELSGNLWEQTVGVNKLNGLQYQGSHGDGHLEDQPSDWLIEAMILRGGAWNSGISLTYRDLAVSDRYYYNLANESARNTTGGRGVVSLKHLEP